MGVVASRQPIRSALWLALSLCATAVCYLLLGAPFAATVQVMVYVGAIVVLIVFAVMLLRMKTDAIDRRGASQIAVALGVAALLGAALFGASKGLGTPAGIDPEFGSAQAVGRVLLGPALLPFELISLLLLAAMVAAISLGRKHA